MASKWSIEKSANIKMLINMIQTAGGIDEDDNIFLPVEKTEHSLLKTSKEKLHHIYTTYAIQPAVIIQADLMMPWLLATMVLEKQTVH